MKRVLPLIVGLSCILAFSHTYAQTPTANPKSEPTRQGGASVPALRLEPVVVVNDSMITDYDIDQKMRMLSLSNRQPISKALQENAIRVLIDENLKYQAARRAGIEVTAEDMDTAVDTIAGKNNQDRQSLQKDLASNGIMLETLENQLRTEIAWNRLVQQKFGARVRPSEEDMTREMENLRKKNAVVYALAQVLVPLPSQAPEAETRQAFNNAKRVQSGIKNGCNDIGKFKETYEKSGRLPEAMPARAFPPPIQSVLSNLGENVASEPVRSEEGFHVIVICDRSVDASFSITEDQVRQQVMAQGFERFADSYLQNLRRDAIVEQR